MSPSEFQKNLSSLLHAQWCMWPVQIFNHTMVCHKYKKDKAPFCKMKGVKTLNDKKIWNMIAAKHNKKKVENV